MDNKLNRTTINEYFEWIADTVDKESNLYKYSKEYLDSEKEIFSQIDHKNDRPFLSVITRTQGKRPEMLTETLLCLTGQSNTNFELLVVGHNLNDDQFKIVNEIIDDMPEWMRNQTRYVPVNGGTRTTPLNAGFEAARGRYIAILDDDDIVFDNWVEEFYKMSLEKPGQVLHTYAIYQDWATVEGTTIPRAAATPTDPFCNDFKLLDEIALNICPPVALAFPAFAFHKLGIRFDESLTTTEDWDYLMRVAFVTGVYNNPTTTCVYRNWINAENSQTLHKKDEWDANYDKIVKRFLSMPVVMPVGSLDRCVSLLTKGVKRIADNRLEKNSELFYNTGDGYSMRKTIKLEPSSCVKEWMFEAKELSNCGRLTSLRFDPCDDGDIILNSITIKLVDNDKKEYLYDLSKVKTNGFTLKDGRVIFIKEDPQVIIEFKTPTKIEEFYVTLDYQESIPDEIICDLITNKKRSLVYRGLRYIYRRLKRIVRRG